VKDELRFDIFSTRQIAESVELTFDVRNLVIHNYGIVNGIFLSKQPTSGLRIGQPYPVFPEKIAAQVKTLIEASGDIEKRATQKFKLAWPASNSA
jgi:hypothetical protein